MATPKAAPGQILDGRFRLLEELQRGGMANVFKAQDLADGGRAVVVKVPLPMFASGLGAWSLFQRSPPFPHDDPLGVASARIVGDPPAPRSLNPAITREAEEIVLRALRRDPAERYASAAAMKVDVEHPERVTVSGLCDRLQPATARRRRWRLARYLTVIAVLPVVAQVVLFGVIWHHLASAR
jgi:serine/threonine protein kinase